MGEDRFHQSARCGRNDIQISHAVEFQPFSHLLYPHYTTPPYAYMNRDIKIVSSIWFLGIFLRLITIHDLRANVLVHLTTYLQFPA